MTTSNLSFRYETIPADIETVRSMVIATGVFNEAEVGIAIELVEDRLQKGEKSDYLFVFAEKGNRVCGYTCYGLIPGTDKRFEIYWIAVDPALHKQGTGRALMKETERRIKQLDGKRVYTETSSKANYTPTRDFYRACGYSIAAQAADFHEDGDDLVIFVKTAVGVTDRPCADV